MTFDAAEEHQSQVPALQQGLRGTGFGTSCRMMCWPTADAHQPLHAPWAGGIPSTSRTPMRLSGG